MWSYKCGSAVMQKFNGKTRPACKSTHEVIGWVTKMKILRWRGKVTQKVIQGKKEINIRWEKHSRECQ